MTSALQLPAFDQTLNEVGAVERLAEFLGRMWFKADQALKVGRLVSVQANFLGRLALIDPYAFSSTGDVWAAAESVELIFYRLYATVYTLKKPSSTQRSVSQASALGDDLAQRLAFTQELMEQVRGVEPRFPPSESRKLEQRVLDDNSIPPEVRLTIQQARCLPVLIVFVYCMDTPMFTSETARTLVRETTRECLDNMIALMLGTCVRKGIRPIELPDGLEMPAPMRLAELEERWQNVQTTWANC